MSDDVAKGLAMIGQLFIRFCDVQNGRLARLRSEEPGLSNVIKEVEDDLQTWQDKYPKASVPKVKVPPKTREEINRARREKRAADKAAKLQLAASKTPEQVPSQPSTDTTLPLQEPAPVKKEHIIKEPVNEPVSEPVIKEAKEKKRKHKHDEKSKIKESDEERKRRKMEKKARKKREKELAAASTSA